MRRVAVISLVAVVLVGTLVLAIVGAGEQRTLAFTLGVPAGSSVVELRPGQEACQTPIAVGAAFDEVELQIGTFRRAGQPLELVVRRGGPDGEVLGRGRLPGGYGDIERPVVAVGSVPDGGAVALCVENRGRRRVALYGAADAAARTSTALVDGRPVGGDLDLVFRTHEPRTTLALVPDVLERMSLFRGGWIGAWLYWLLLAGVVIGAPALLGFALAGAVRDPRELPREDAGEPGASSSEPEKATKG